MDKEKLKKEFKEISKELKHILRIERSISLKRCTLEQKAWRLARELNTLEGKPNSPTTEILR